MKKGAFAALIFNVKALTIGKLPLTEIQKRQQLRVGVGFCEWLTGKVVSLMPDFSKEFQDKYVGVVLTQINSEREVVIAYISQKLQQKLLAMKKNIWY